MFGKKPLLDRLEKHIGWIAVPNIAVLIITLQCFGMGVAVFRPEWRQMLVLDPDLVMQGQYWRLLSFLSQAAPTHPLFLIIYFWFLYFILNILESHWGAFKTTLYVLISALAMITMSFVLRVQVTDIQYFTESFFFAAAALIPNYEIQLLFPPIPVKMKWLAWIFLGLVGIEFLRAPLIGKFFIIGIFSNYLLFFGRLHYRQVKELIRKNKMKNKLK
jgi:hypothetical protein